MSMATTVTEQRAESATGGGPRLGVVRTETDELTSRLGELAGHIHAATAELVELLARLDACAG